MEEMKGNYDERALRRGVKYPIFEIAVIILILMGCLKGFNRIVQRVYNEVWWAVSEVLTR